MDFITLVVYVDDLFITRSSDVLIQQVKSSLHMDFTIKDLGVAKYFLSLEITRSSQGIYVTQRKYIFDLIKDVGLSSAKHVSKPLPK